MNIILTLMLLCSIILFSNAIAREGELWGDMTITSRHNRDYWDKETVNGEVRREEFNENYFGLGLVYGLTDYVDFSIGAIDKNSYDNFSIYAVGNIKYPLFDTPDIFRIEPGIALGVSSGYNDTPEDKYVIGGVVLPVILPNISIIVGDDFLARISYLPDIRSDTTSVILFQASIRIF